MYKLLEESISTFNIDEINKERKALLDKLVDFVQNKRDKGEIINLNFICTHNSRRSHLSQIWAQVAASKYDIGNVHCYSGGTEATAMFTMVKKTLESQGFRISMLSKEENPVYGISFAENLPPIIAFSKKYDHEFNPVSKFGAILTCTSADKGCPYIPGAEGRIPITYIDPKVSDGTPLQEQTYMERSVQIGTEMAYVFSKIR